jgi:DNA-binding NtrC family response regulator
MTLSTVPYAIVVDDDPLIMMDTTMILEDAGFRVHDAMSGDEAKIILAEHWESIILLFSDVDMPGETNGFGLARHVAESWPAIEIVIASGHALPEIGDMPEKATFISKPFSKHVVHDHLRKILPDDRKPEPLKTAV